MSQAAGNTSNGRMQALAAANAGLAVKDAMNAIQAGQQTQGASTADKLGGISLSVSLGSKKPKQQRQPKQHGQRLQRTSGGNVAIVASHANSSTVNNTNNSPPLPADITVQGSTINAGGAANITTSTSRLNQAINPTSLLSN